MANSSFKKSSIATPVSVAEGGTHLTTIPLGSALAANTLDVLTAITSNTGTLVLTNTDGVISWGAPGGHDAVTLDINAETLLSLSTQELGLDTQTANLIFSGPASGVAAVPTFRSLVAGDIPDLSGTYQPLDASLTSISGLTYVSGSFIALTATDTYSVRTYAQVLSDIGAAPALGADDNYVTDAEKAALHAAGSDDTFTIANEATDTTCFPLFATAATGDLGAKTNAGLSFNSATAILTATGFAGPLTGNVTGDVSGSSGSCTGQAATVATIAGLAPNTATTAAAQPNITSLGTLTTLTVDNLNLNGNTIISTDVNGNINITPNGTGKNVLANSQITSLTASEIVITDASKNLVSAAVATYPSLTELTYVKGVSSAIQTQLGTKLANIVEDTTPELGGELDAGAHSIGFTQQTVTYNETTTTVDWKLSNKASMTFGAGNIGTFAFTNPSNPCNLVLKLVQDGTGGRVVTAWDADIKWPSGNSPTLSTGANAIDVISFYWDGQNYLGQSSLNFS